MYKFFEKVGAVMKNHCSVCVDDFCLFCSFSCSMGGGLFNLTLDINEVCDLNDCK